MVTNLVKSISISSAIENIPQVEEFVDVLYNEYRFSKEIYGNVLISLIELTNNAIVHGNKKDPRKKVHIEAFVDNNVLICHVKDEGKGFDFTNLPDPLAKENLEKPFGRGIFFVKNLSDECIFHDNGSNVEVHFQLK